MTSAPEQTGSLVRQPVKSGTGPERAYLAAATESEGRGAGAAPAAIR